MNLYNGRLEFRKEGWERQPHLDRSVMGTTLFAFTNGELRALVSQERGKWHMSVSCADRYPVWEEIKSARYSLIPHEVTMAQILPPPGQWVNLHPNCFHLYEIDDKEW